MNYNKLFEKIISAIKEALYEDAIIGYKNFFIKIFRKDTQKDIDFVQLHKKDIMTFFNEGYAYIGLNNFIGCQNERALLKNFDVLKIAYKDEEPIAMSIYSNYLDGHKCVGITATANENLRDLGKKAINEIIKQDISLYRQFYWIECSGPIEHLYHKYGAIAIPAEYVSYFLREHFYFEKDKDGFHYIRNLKNGDKATKVIFGFNNKETFNKIVKSNEQYFIEAFKRIEANIDVNETSMNLTMHDASFYKINVFVEAWLEEGQSEFTPTCKEMLKKEIDYLDSYIKSKESYLLTEHKYNLYKQAVENGKDLLESTTDLTLHIFK